MPGPLGLPPVEAPANPALVELGKKIFFDTRLSADNTLSCASCHNPSLGFADGRRLSLGVNQKTGTRNAPSLLNSAYGRLHFWDGRANSLEEQAGGPMSNTVEMNQSHDVSVRKLSADPALASAFEQAFGSKAIDIDRIRRALAAYERTLLSGASPFDRYRYGGDKSAMSAAAIRGLALFENPNKGNCAACHLIGPKDALFTDHLFHNLGVGLDEDGEPKDLGRYEVTKRDADRGAFKTPSLRNVALTAPYMHDGSIKSLRAVVDFYNGGGSSSPHLDPRIKPLGLSSAEVDDLVQFLEALNGDLPSK
ncbi:cytochrome-c peroxidase [Bryobacter aggregatus]|uniref:cytochrome-c peroxidase n=1 Tax=Bryobacter aggregatus TaxID=360054 RepID=UPI000A4473FA|nr:cytochrome c peroxidase [Bryobacter aggregatus]